MKDYSTLDNTLSFHLFIEGEGFLLWHICNERDLRKQGHIRLTIPFSRLLRPGRDAYSNQDILS